MSEKFITESQKLFNIVFTNQVKKIRSKPNTIFENLEYVNEMEMYGKFIDSSYYDKVIQENSQYNKMNLIQDFIFEEYSNIYYGVKQRLTLMESEGQNTSFSQHYLLENTLETFPEMIKTEITPAIFEEAIQVNSTDPRYKELQEAGILYGGGMAAGTMALGGTPLIAAGVGTATALAIELFMPTKWSMIIDKKIVSFASFLARGLLGTSSILGTMFDSMKSSQQSIEGFDNLNLNSDVVKVFERIGQRHTFNNGTGAESLNVIMSKCIDANKEVFDKNNFFVGNITNGNIYRNVINSMFINNGNRTSGNSLKYDKLLRFRKCVASSLSDVYKFTMIANLKDVKNYEQILKASNQGFTSNPEQLLNFVDIRNEHAKEIKENLLDLIRLRMIINEMIITFKQGNFEVDREAGTFLEQKFRVVDKEISDYLRAHKQEIGTFDKKEYTGIPPKSNSPFNNSYKPIGGSAIQGSGFQSNSEAVPTEASSPIVEEPQSRLNF